MSNKEMSLKNKNGRKPRRVRCLACGKLVEVSYSLIEDFAVEKYTISGKRVCICSSCVEDLDYAFSEMEAEAAETTSTDISTINSEKCVLSDKEKEARVKDIEKEVRDNYTCLEYSIKSFEQYVNKRVIGQENAIRRIIYTIYYNVRTSFMHEVGMGYMKPSNILIRGDTGVGKTHSVKTILGVMGIPYYIANVTSMTSAGYVGSKVEKALEGLYSTAGKDLYKAEHGVLVLDEIDKKAKEDSNGRDVVGKAVQQELLKILEPSKVWIYDGTVEFDTSHLTVILMGAFVGLDDIIDKRLNTKKIGFETENKEEKDRKVIPDDLIKYGFIPEFIGRIPVIIEMNSLTAQNIVDIIYLAEGSVFRQIRSIFDANDVVLTVDDMLITDMAYEMVESKTGARDIEKKIKELFENALYNLFQNPGSGFCDIDAEGNTTLLIENPSTKERKTIYIEKGGF